MQQYTHTNLLVLILIYTVTHLHCSTGDWCIPCGFVPVHTFSIRLLWRSWKGFLSAYMSTGASLLTFFIYKATANTGNIMASDTGCICKYKRHCNKQKHPTLSISFADTHCGWLGTTVWKAWQKRTSWQILQGCQLGRSCLEPILDNPLLRIPWLKTKNLT